MSIELTLRFPSLNDIADLIDSHASQIQPAVKPWLSELSVEALAYCSCGWFGQSWGAHLADVLVWAATDDEDGYEPWSGD